MLHHAFRDFPSRLATVRRMKFFGDPWKLELLNRGEQVPTPAGDPCISCERPILAHHRGVMLPHHSEVGGPHEHPCHLDCLASDLGLEVP